MNEWTNMTYATWTYITVIVILCNLSYQYVFFSVAQVRNIDEHQFSRH
jgi:hypothetical protein